MEKRKQSFDGDTPDKRFRFDEDDGEAADEAEFYMEQRLVGWVIGTKGSTLKEIEQAYSVRVVVEQDTKELGYSKVKITGSRERWQAAADHINQSLSRAVTSLDGASSAGPFLLDTPPNAPPMDCVEEEIRIEQRYVGWLVGKGGGVIRDIEQKCGCRISVKQDTRAHGYSRAVFNGTSEQRQQAKQMIEDSIERAKAVDPRPPEQPKEDGEMQIEQKWVGWLLGRGGGVLKEIEEAKAVQIKVDQSTKPYGYSTIKITGDPDQVESARERIQAQLTKVGGGVYDSNATGEDWVQVEQKWVGWLLGKSGAVMKEIEGQSGARVKVDQTGKDRGYSTVCMSGTWDSIAKAKNMVMEKLAQVDPSGKFISGGQLEDNGGGRRYDDRASRSHGDRGGGRSWTEAATQMAYRAREEAPEPATAAYEAARELSSLSEQLADQPAGGHDLAKMRQIAQQLLAATEPGPAPGQIVGRVRSSAQSTSRGHVDHSSRGRPPLVAPRRGAGATGSTSPAYRSSGYGQEEAELQVEQKLVGYILGPKGALMKEIEAESGAKVKIDQSTKEHGYSIVKMSGSSSAVHHAQSRIQASVARASGEKTSPTPVIVGNAQGSYREDSRRRDTRDAQSSEVEEMQVEQRCVGWLLGCKGIVMKEIEQKSGARISIDQSTKEQGFSTVKISGSRDRIEDARSLVNEKIAQADPGGRRERDGGGLH